MTDFFGGVARVEVAPRVSASDDAAEAGWDQAQTSGKDVQPQQRPFKALYDRSSKSTGMARPDSGQQIWSTALGGAVLVGAALFVYTHCH